MTRLGITLGLVMLLAQDPPKGETPKQETPPAEPSTAYVALTGGNEGGVRYANNMEDYALRYIEDHRLLEPGEQIVRGLSGLGRRVVVWFVAFLCHRDSAGWRLCITASHRESSANPPDRFHNEYSI